MPGNKKQKKTRRLVQSTQQNIPIRDFVNGVVVTKNNDYVQIMEVRPVPFFLKREKDKQEIIESFEAFLRNAPDELHIKAISLPADLSPQIKDTEDSIQIESNNNCKRMEYEYRDQLLRTERASVSRRFFISFKYDFEKQSAFAKPGIRDIISTLKAQYAQMAANLAACGNVVVHGDPNNPNEMPARLFYTLLNRKKSTSVRFEDHLEKVLSKYYEEYQTEDFSTPPGDYIAPDVMDFTDGKYVICDDVYYSFLYIPSEGYQSNYVASWLSNIVNSGLIGVDVDVFLKRLPKEAMKREAQRKRGHSVSDLSNATNISDSLLRAQSTLNAADYIFASVSQGNDPYAVGTLITVTGDSPQEVDEKISILKNIGKSMMTPIKPLLLQQEEAFRAALPLVNIDKGLFNKMSRNMVTEGAAATAYIFTAFELIHENGMYLAEDIKTNSPVIPDFFESTVFTNPHIFVCGKTGAGKSVTIMLMAIRARLKQYQVFILAPEKQDEYERLTAAIGGQFVSIGNGSSARLNPFEIFVPSEEAVKRAELINRKKDTASYLSMKVATLSDLFGVFFKDFRLSLYEQQKLTEAIYTVYANYGITENNDSIWADKEKKIKKEMPIMEDLVNVLEQDNETKNIGISLRRLTRGPGAHFNGRTNVDVTNKFFVLGLEHNTNDMLGLSIMMAMDYVWSQVKQDRTQKKLLIMDEWWKMAYNPLAAEESLEIAKLARSYGCSMIIATQQITDIFGVENGKYGEGVMNSCATKILLSMEEKEIESVQKLVNLTPEECSELAQNNQRGKGLFISTQNRMHIAFKPSNTEKLLTFTDQKTLEEVERRRRQELIEEERQRKLDSLPSFYDLFTNEDGIETIDLIDSEEFLNDMNLPKLYTTEEINNMEDNK